MNSSYLLQGGNQNSRFLAARPRPNIAETAPKATTAAEFSLPVCGNACESLAVAAALALLVDAGTVANEALATYASY